MKLDSPQDNSPYYWPQAEQKDTFCTDRNRSSRNNEKRRSLGPAPPSLSGCYPPPTPSPHCSLHTAHSARRACRIDIDIHDIAIDIIICPTDTSVMWVSDKHADRWGAEWSCKFSPAVVMHPFVLPPAVTAVTLELGQYCGSSPAWSLFSSVGLGSLLPLSLCQRVCSAGHSRPDHLLSRVLTGSGWRWYSGPTKKKSVLYCLGGGGGG